MSKKLSERGHSRFVAEQMVRAYAPFEGLSMEAIDAALQQHLARKQSAVVAVIQRHGVIGTLQQPRRFCDADLEALQRARELALTEVERPQSFVSRHSERATRSDQAKHQIKRRGTSFDGLDELVQEVIGRKKYATRYLGWIGSAVAEVRSSWKSSGRGSRCPSETTVRERIEKVLAE